VLERVDDKRVGRPGKPRGVQPVTGADAAARSEVGAARGIRPSGEVALRIDRGVATLTLGRRAAHNALTIEMLEAFHAAIDRIEREGTIRLVVLRGEGAHLCAGADIKDTLLSIQDGAPEEADHFLVREYALDLRLARLAVPFVVIADGVTMGGGLGLGFGGYIVATERSRFAMPEARIGLLTDVGATHELKSRLGRPLARYFSWTSEAFNGRDALRWGLADALIESDQIEDLLDCLGKAARGEAGSVTRGSAELAFLRKRVAGGVPASKGRWTTRNGRRVNDRLSELAEKHFGLTTRSDILRSLEAAAAGANDEEERRWARSTLAAIGKRSPVSIWACDLLLGLDYDEMARAAARSTVTATGTTEAAARPEWLIYLREELGRSNLDIGGLADLGRAEPRGIALAVEFLLATAMFRLADCAEGLTAFRDKRDPDFPSAREPLGVHRALFLEGAGWTLLRHAARLARDRFWLDVAHDELDWIRKPLEGYDASSFPCACWFGDGALNASVEAVDRWVARGLGAQVAFIWEGDRIDSDRRPLERRSITYAELLEEVRRCAAALRALGLRRGDSLVLYMPNIIETYVVQLAAARIGVVYHPVFAGFAREELSDRLHMMGARVLITADGAFRKGEVIQYKRDYVDPALGDFVPVERAIDLARRVLGEHDRKHEGRGDDRAGRVLEGIEEALIDKVSIEKRKVRALLARGLAEGAASAGTEEDGNGRTVSRGALSNIEDPTRPLIDRIEQAARLLDEEEGEGAGKAGARDSSDDAAPSAALTPEEEALQGQERRIAAAFAACLDEIQSPVDKVVVLRRLGTRGQGEWIDGRDLSFDDFLEAGKQAGAPSGPEPMGAEDALFVMFTSGSTGKPKGLVHTHGGYLARLPFLIRTVFGLTRDQRILTVADPGWITGQSYVCWGPLTYGMTSILVGFVPSEDRLWAAVERYRANFLKTGVTGIRASMGDDPEHIRSHDLSSLRHRGGDSTLAEIQRLIESRNGSSSSMTAAADRGRGLPQLSRDLRASYLSRWSGRPADWPSLFDEAIVQGSGNGKTPGADGSRGGRCGLTHDALADLRADIVTIARRAERDETRYTSCSCAEPLDAAVQAWWEAHIGPMMNCYWRTEDSGPETGAAPTAYPQAPDASARPLPWADPRVFVIRDEDGNTTEARPAAVGEKGTVFVRLNPGIARGTWIRPHGEEERSDRQAYGHENAAAWRTDPRFRQIYHADVPGWHNTGDAGVCNENGTLTFLGRDDEVLNVSGHRVGTQEIEGAVRSHPAVSNVAAIGIPAEVRGDNPVLFVKLREGHAPSGLLDNQLREAVAESKGSHVAPTADFIFYVANLPTTKSGKVLRRVLKYAAALDRDALAAALDKLRDERLRAGLIAADREAVQSLFPPLQRQGRTLRLGSVATVDQMAVLIDVLNAVARRRELTIDARPSGVPAAQTPGIEGESARPESQYRPCVAPDEEVYCLGRTDFRPGIDPLPSAQQAWGMTRDTHGRPQHGEPEKALIRIVEPVPGDPEPNELIVQNLFAGSTHNVLHALMADPVSPFEWHRKPYHTLGSGAVCRVVRCGREVDRQGLFTPGQLAVNFPALYRVLDPRVSEDAMHAGFEIQGFETPDGTLRPFDRVSATQLLPVPRGLTLEQASSFMLNLVTVYRALTRRMPVRRGQSLLIEGATGGTGSHAVEIGRILGARVIGQVSSETRGRQVLDMGAAAFIDRTDPAIRGIWTVVPDEPGEWIEWERAGAPLLEMIRERNDGRLVDAVVSFTGRPAFGRLVQMLAPGGRLTFFGAFLGYCQRFLGRGPEQGASDETPATMFGRAGLRAGMGVLVHYGVGVGGGHEDPNGIEAIQEAAETGAQVAVLTNTDGQGAWLNRHSTLASRIVGTVSLESLKRGSRFEWPERMPDFDLDPARYERYERLTLKPLASAVGRLLKTPSEPRGRPDLIYSRGDEDTLAADLFMVKPFTGSVVYGEARCRPYTMYAPQVWMRQRQMLFPSFEIIGSHMGNPQQGREVIGWIAQGILSIRPPRVYEADQAPRAFQDMHTNAASGSFVVHLTSPGRNLMTGREIDEANGAIFFDDKYVTVRLDSIRSAEVIGDGAATHVARVTLRSAGGRPPSLARDAIYQIGDAFRRLEKDPRVAAVILTGEGTVAFLAGQDLRQLYDDVEDIEAAVTIARDAQRIFDAVEAFPHPVISVANGVALGGGHELLMATHYRLAVRSPRVRIGQPEIVLGIIPGFAGTQRLTRLLIDRWGLERGVREALEMVLTGRHYEVEEALSLGLLDEVVDANALERAYALAFEHARAGRAGGSDPLGAAHEERRRARDAWRRPVDLPAGFLDHDARLALVLGQAMRPEVGRGVPVVRAIEATVKGLREGFEAGCDREAWSFASLVVDERFGRRGIRRFLERQEQAPVPARRTEKLSEGRWKP
jgi:acyl-coenzyme A synthetase/AMP-(fatty) acid ligase/enoyl-CoA hydratase/carnithine racemase/NADPH:quinone reductase-like Zn-dependent oxidoreductase